MGTIMSASGRDARRNRLRRPSGWIRKVRLAAVLAGLLAPTTLQAEDLAGGYVVLELYTSQGCSSCPSADRLLDEMAKSGMAALPRLDDSSGTLIPLGFHVDYWDYLGWRDSMARAIFSERQRQYARYRKKLMVYTPQAIVNGQRMMVGSKLQHIVDAVGSTKRAAPLEVESEWRSDRGLRVAMPAGGLDLRKDVDVVYLRYRTEPQVVNIRGGENRGRNVVYSNVVTELRMLGCWDGSDDFDRLVDIGNAPEATEQQLVLLQEGGFGPIIGVGLLDVAAPSSASIATDGKAGSGQVSDGRSPC